MRFIWDPKKAKANWSKHKVSFEEATSVFYDPLAKIMDDPDHSSNFDERLILIGYKKDKNA